MKQQRRNATRIAITLGLIASLAGCSGSTASSTDPVPANPDLTVLAQDIKFDQKEYTAKPGNVTLAYLSKGNQSHNLIIQDASGNKIGKELVVGPGAETGSTYPLTAGTYKMYCTVPGHKQSMNAIITIS